MFGQSLVLAPGTMLQLLSHCQDPRPRQLDAVYRVSSLDGPVNSFFMKKD